MYRTIWLSDIHLGTELCQSDNLYSFLKSLELPDGSYAVKKLYLVGDIIDMTQLNHKLLWGKHRKVLRKFLRMADRGVEVVYIPGNHDYQLRTEIEGFPDKTSFDGISLRMNDIHTTLAGKRYLVMHGDEFDGFVLTFPFLYALGDAAYKIMVGLNAAQNWIRRKLGYQEWSFSLWIKQNVKRAVQFVNHFEKLIAEHARAQSVDGVIAGHIHKAENTTVDGIHYLNCGCWTEFCSYVAEKEDGEMVSVYFFAPVL